MKIEQFEKAKELLEDLDGVKEIKRAMIEESNHWWGVITPDVRRRIGVDGYRMPDVLREEYIYRKIN